MFSESTICRICLRSRKRLTGSWNFRQISTSPPCFASSSSSSFASSSHSRPSPKLRYIPISFFVLPPVLWYLSQTYSEDTISPYVYTDHPVSSARKVSEQHKEVVITLSEASSAAFSKTGISASDPQTATESQTIMVHHVMVKSPDLMIERPYTPVNDVDADGEVRLVVKRVRGGEVGRLVHSLQPGQNVGLRGPIPTFSLDPTRYDRVIMVSSGTGIAPFLQYLSKVPGPSAVSPEAGWRGTQFDLIHATPPSGRIDWVSDATLLPRLQAKYGDNLTIHPYPFDSIPIEQLSGLIRGDKGQKVMVLVCLPPAMMRPLCGPLTVTLQQGELTGVLRDLGLEAHQVIKLE